MQLLSLVRDGLGSPELLLLRALDVLSAPLEVPLLLLVLPDPLDVVVGDVADHLRVGLNTGSPSVSNWSGGNAWKPIPIAVKRSLIRNQRNKDSLMPQ